MKVPAPLRFLLVLALAGWTTLCCCERRALATAIFGADAASAAKDSTNTASNASGGCVERCCSACDADAASTAAERPTPAERDRGCCSDGCCLKATTPPIVLELALDLVGREPPALGRAVAARALGNDPRRALRDNEAHPPPWRILVVSARLRI